MKPQQIWQRT